MAERIEAIEVLAALAGVLRRLGLRWYVFGAQAVVIWGRPRMTADVDVTVDLGQEAPSRLVAALCDAGFRLRIERDVDDFVARTRVMPFVHESTRLPLDVVLAGPGLEQEFLDRAEEVDLGAIRVPVLCAEDLVVTKILAGRPKDLDDVAGILRERGPRLDAGLMRATLALIERALDRSDLVAALDSELARARR